MENTDMNTQESAAAPVVATGATPVEPALAVTPEPQRENKLPLIISAVVGILVLLGAGYYFYSQQYGKGDVIGVVNGEKIYQTELDESLAIVRENPAAYGIDPASATLETEAQTIAMDILVNNALLITAATKEGFSAKDEEVEESYKTLVAQIGGEETLKSQLAAVGLSEERLRDNLRERATVDAYIESTTDVENIQVSAEEVTGFIDSLKAGGVELPENVEDLKPQIEAEIRAQKQQQLITALLQRLRDEAEIEILI